MLRASCIILPVALLLGCASGPRPAPPTPPYTPKFSYRTSQANGGKIDVTVGIIAPQFSGDGTSYWNEEKNDEAARGMVRGLRTEFNALLIAKGFNTTGPFDSLDNMTFPEKKGADFVLYPDIDVAESYKIENARPEVRTGLLAGRQVVTVCDLSFSLSGAISIVAREPLSGEKVWIKKVDVSIPSQQFAGEDKVCYKQAITREIKDAWAKAHETMFQSLMRDLDRYVNAEEFQTLKKQAAELRAKKVY